MHAYEVDIKWETGRKGKMSSPELPLTFEVATPPQFPGGEKGIWSPEHLYTFLIQLSGKPDKALDPDTENLWVTDTWVKNWDFVTVYIIDEKKGKTYNSKFD